MLQLLWFLDWAFAMGSIGQQPMTAEMNRLSSVSPLLQSELSLDFPRAFSPCILDSKDRNPSQYNPTQHSTVSSESVLEVVGQQLEMKQIFKKSDLCEFQDEEVLGVNDDFELFSFEDLMGVNPI